MSRAAKTPQLFLSIGDRLLFGPAADLKAPKVYIVKYVEAYSVWNVTRKYCLRRPSYHNRNNRCCNKDSCIGIENITKSIHRQLLMMRDYEEIIGVSQKERASVFSRAST